jgi:hypothetical protein
MNLSEKQLIVLLRVLEGSLSIVDNGAYFGFSQDVRRDIYHQVLNQQNDKVGTKENQ